MLEKVSIITPTYNRAALIGETIRSVLAQSYVNWELIIIDDHSQDNTSEVVGAFQAEDGRVFFFTKPQDYPEGPAASRNFGLQKASGQYIVYLDSDDLLAPFCLEQRVNAFVNHPDKDFLVFPQATLATVSNVSKLINIPTSDEPIDRFLRLSPYSLDVPWLNTAPIWKRSSIDSFGLTWNESLFWDDVVYHFTALTLGMQSSFVNAPVDSFYRQHTQQREGERIHQVEYYQEYANLLVFFVEQLRNFGLYSPSRQGALLASFFQLWVLKLIDAGHWVPQKEAIKLMVRVLGLSRGAFFQLRSYLQLRRCFHLYPKITYYLNRLFRYLGRKSYFGTPSSHYLQVAYEQPTR